MGLGMSLPTWQVIVVQTFLLGFLQFGDKVLPDNFIARKTCHAGSGALMLLLDPTDALARYFVYLVVVTSLSMTWKVWPSFLPTFRFGQDYDAGITGYLAIVGTWFYMQNPVRVLAPLFFADPAGAVCGKYFTKKGLNKNWYENKSIMGSLAVFLFAYLSLSTASTQRRVVLAFLCMLAEALGGKTYDNLAIASVVIGSWYLENKAML
mmetsp:Transcript_81822/g.128865  ORF Transcript_81822/g.128865 Transcript_81822/m.128865 type:complete len:208 (+) Transcript_81822:48-671(+)